MHGEIVLAALVLVVAILVAGDFFRRTSDAPHEYPAGTEPGNEPGPARDAGRETYPARRVGTAASLLPHEAAVAAPPVGTRPDGARRGSARETSARQDRDAGTAASSATPGGPQANWLVRTRLVLLAVVSAAAAALAVAGFIRAIGAFQRASADSNVSSMRDGDIVSAILA